MSVLFRKEHIDAKLPTKANYEDAGFDLRAIKDYVIEPGETVLVDTGVSVAVPRSQVGLLFQRSSMVKVGLQLANCVGVIDSGYRGNLMVAIRNTNGESHCSILKGDRVAQLVIVPFWMTDAAWFNGDETEWRDTTRGLGGFGSSGKS